MVHVHFGEYGNCTWYDQELHFQRPHKTHKNNHPFIAKNGRGGIISFGLDFLFIKLEEFTEDG
jgi:hypothetical protein